MKSTNIPSMNTILKATHKMSGILFLLILLFVAQSLNAQNTNEINPDLLENLQWTNIGPKRGGRSIAAAGSSARPNEYYFGATGGGLWKTVDGGNSWNPVTDGKINSSSVGAVAVAQSNPDIVYMGMGEAQLRQNVLQGDGIYRSSDGGDTWKHLGLSETQAISRVRIHPTDPNRVYVAALGHTFGQNSERGIYRTKDGGESWEKVLFKDDKTGAIDLSMDPNDPDVLYATLWEVYRKPYILWSGGEGSGLYKSVDGGDTWTELTGNQGLPKGIWGKSTVSVSGADSKRVYVNVEAENGGLYRSDDGGETFELINNHRDLWQRAFYFLRIQADPVDRDVVYILSFKLIKSEDGGETFHYLPPSHNDHHDLWIDPKNPKRMINANDGGAVVSVTGGQTWTHFRYATAQIYRLSVTNDFPYHVAGGQQDNSTAVVPSDGGYLRNERIAPGEMMYAAGGGENGYVVQHPTKLNIFYSGKTNALDRYDRNTGLVTDVQPFPRIVMGEAAKVMPERWNWNYPIVVSPAEPDALFVGSQYLWKSNDEGKTWAKISPDLTRADEATMGDSGGPIVFDQDGPEIYATIYTIEPSPLKKDIIWVGSDDGFINLTRDGGKTWSNVTPEDLLKDSKVSGIKASQHNPAVAYATARRYEMDDRAPYVWKTEDYGKSWKKIVTGIQANDFGHSITEDPIKEGLVYLGTENGVYVSFNGGNNWQSLSNNLPITPVMGIAVKQNDLVIATHGRSFWKMQNIELLRQVSVANISDKPFHLFKPAKAIRRATPATIDFFVKEKDSQIILDIVDDKGNMVVQLVNEKTTNSGMIRLNWDLRYEGATTFANIILEGGKPDRGPWATPGTYSARLTVNGKTQTESFEVEKDPRLTDVSVEDMKEQFELAMKIRTCESAANEAVILYRKVKADVENILESSNSNSLQKQAGSFLTKITLVADKFYQLKNQSPKDKIAFPIRLNDRLTGLRSHLEVGDMKPTAAYLNVYDELAAELKMHLDELYEVLDADMSKLNKKLVQSKLEPVSAAKSKNMIKFDEQYNQ
ncbi:WD40/YVTN/BNR-like repeat-containing protein [Saccharicrinis sp. GN24d3]